MENIIEEEHISLHTTWTEYEKSLNKEEIEILEIPNYLYFGETTDEKGNLIKGGTLIIKDYPKLKTLYANHCSLERVEINCPTLKHLYLIGNAIKSIDLSKVPNLETLQIPYNKLTFLEVNHLKNLNLLWCFSNKLNSLDIFNLTKLEDLNTSNCFDNQRFYSQQYLNKKYKETKVFSGMRLLRINNCPNIKNLDIDINDIILANFTKLTKLECISLRRNGISVYHKFSENGEIIKEIVREKKKKIILKLNSSKLRIIDTKKSNIEQIINKGIVYDYQNPTPFLQTVDNPWKLRMIGSHTYEGDKKDWDEWAEIEKNPRADAPTYWEHEYYQLERKEQKEISQQIQNKWYIRAV